jgi:predicted nucleotidyltransferase
LIINESLFEFIRSKLNISDLFDEIETVYLGGSVSEGLGNRFSDLDIYVIGRPSKHTLSELNIDSYCNVVSIKQIITDYDNKQIRIDLHALSKSYIDELGLIIVEGRSIKLSDLEIDIVHRLKTGISVLNMNAFKAIASKIDFSVFNQHISFMYYTKATNILEDCLGFIDQNDLETAMISSKKLIESSVDSYLAFLGDTTPRDKWRIRKIYRTIPDNSLIRQKFHALMFNPVDLTKKSEMKKYFNHAIDFFNLISDEMTKKYSLAQILS